VEGRRRRTRGEGISRSREMGRAPCCDKANVKKGPWSPEEDDKLKEYIEKYGTGGNWIALPQKAGNQFHTQNKKRKGEGETSSLKSGVQLACF